MSAASKQSGFTLIELLIAGLIFTFIMMSVSQLFIDALDIQRRAAGYQKIQQNQIFVLESISRAVRVSAVKSGQECTADSIAGADELTIDHPVHGIVTYRYLKTPDGRGYIDREAADLTEHEVMTADDVDVTRLGFCVIGAGFDGEQARITIPMTIKALSSRPNAQVEVSSQTTIVSRDLVEELTN